jgi:uncharacterized protein (DUF305 family)
MGLDGRRVAAGLLAVAIAISVSACSRPSRSVQPVRDTVITSSSDAHAAIHNAEDAAFARNMIPHHQQGVDMAAMVPARSTNPTVIVIAKHIAMDQTAEIQILTELLAQWGEPVTPPNGAAGHHGGPPMGGMVDDTTMAQLPLLRGAAFDAQWLQAMIVHHQGAITMAQSEIAAGQSPDAIKMAHIIIKAQQFEISRMTDLLLPAE